MVVNARDFARYIIYLVKSCQLCLWRKRKSLGNVPVLQGPYNLWRRGGLGCSLSHHAVFNEKTIILENWVQGIKYAVKSDKWNDVAGKYKLDIHTEKGTKSFNLNVKSASSASIITTDTISAKFTYDGKQVKINFTAEKKINEFYNNFK